MKLSISRSSAVRRSMVGGTKRSPVFVQRMVKDGDRLWHMHLVGHIMAFTAVLVNSRYKTTLSMVRKVKHLKEENKQNPA